MSRWKIYSGVNLYIITTTIVEWQDVFVSIPMFEALVDSLKYCSTHKGLHLHGYVIMPNHAHYIISSEPSERISEIMRDFNRFTSQQLTALLDEGQKINILKVFQKAAEEEKRGNRYKVWQEGFHPIAIDTIDLYQQKLDYLHDNPVRKGFVERAEHWKYSSARNYILDDHSIMKVECLE
jgi:REP element-mobilizing transposase RayT